MKRWHDDFFPLNKWLVNNIFVARLHAITDLPIFLDEMLSPVPAIPLTNKAAEFRITYMQNNSQCQDMKLCRKMYSIYRDKKSLSLEYRSYTRQNLSHKYKKSHTCLHPHKNGDDFQVAADLPAMMTVTDLLEE